MDKRNNCEIYQMSRMEPLLLKVNQPDSQSFAVNQFNYQQSFPGLWHYHPEYELTLIERGTGVRFVGDHIDRFETGDLVLIGKNLSHTWKSNNPTSGPESPGALVIHFREDFLGESFFSIPEMVIVRSLLMKSSKGLRVTGPTQKVITEEMRLIPHLHGPFRLLKLLEILTLLASSKDLSVLASESYRNYAVESDGDRLNTVYTYIMNNFQKTLRLSEVAEMANMSPTAFSRYFTQRTRKPFSQFLIEKKVGYACKLLMGKRFSILQICYECGFRNVSSFNKQFKKITGLTPRQYQLIYKPFGDQSPERNRDENRTPNYFE